MFHRQQRSQHVGAERFRVVRCGQPDDGRRAPFGAGIVNRDVEPAEGFEWSSPGELIHPGDWSSILSVTSNQTKSAYRRCTRNDIRVVSRDVAHHIAEADSANRQAVTRPSGCRKALRTLTLHPLWLPERVGANDRQHDAPR
jgi:hypothetical protein